MQALHKFLLFHVLTSLGHNAHGGKIIHGEKAPENSMLYMVSLQSNGGQHRCGGFLISKDFVLTAAHCDVGITRVVVGTHDLRKVANQNVNFIEKKYKHPSYRSAFQGYDIMLLKLSREVKLDNRVQTIPLPSSDLNIKDNEMCRATGWGYTDTSPYQAVDELRVADVPFVSRQVCQRMWSNLPATAICAGGYRTKKGVCNGDSGGPLVCQGKAVGIASYVRKIGGICDYPDVPNVFADISKFIPWIKTIVKGM